MESVASLSPLLLFQRADWIVKLVVLSLLAASFLSWTIIIGKYIYMKRINHLSKLFAAMVGDEDDLAQLEPPARHYPEIPLIRMFLRLFEEARLVLAETRDRDIVEIEERIGLRLGRMARIEIMHSRHGLENWLSALASIGSTSPFIGLFGTVWGIMNSFNAITQLGNASLTAVAPGIAEALFATALGLFAAIPAVIAYNKLSSDNRRYLSDMALFAEELCNLPVKRFG